MNHKRKRPKHQRSGCLFCKPYKDDRDSRPAKASVRRKTQKEQAQ
jgi:hypothetical protein